MTGEKRGNLLRPDIPASANKEGGEVAVLEGLGVDIAVEVDSEEESVGINSIKAGRRLNNLVSQRGDELDVGDLESWLLEDALDGLVAALL